MSDQPGLPDSFPIRLTHLDDAGAARMVDVTAKPPTVRTAGATAFVACSPSIVAALRDGAVPKGDVLAVARVAGIAAAKRVPDLLPLAHVIGVHAAGWTWPSRTTACASARLCAPPTARAWRWRR